MTSQAECKAQYKTGDGVHSRADPWVAATMFMNIAVIVIGFVAVATAAVADAADNEARLSVASANNAFAFDLYDVLRGEPGNLIVSPLSAAAVLALAYQGAGGNTAVQMRNALHLPEDQQRVRDGYRNLIDSLQSSDELTLRMANKVYADQRLQVKEAFQRTAVDNFRAAAESVDFQQAEAARTAINRWVEETTEGKIKDLLPKDSLSPATLMVLVNAIYFRGTWLRPFEESDTRSETFHVSATEQKNVQMMHRTADFLYCGAVPGMPARAVSLPYLGDRNVRMMILLPNEITGLSDVEPKLKELNFTQLSECMNWREVAVSLPKFTIESTFQLHEKLPELGIQDLFQAGVANLTGILDVSVHVSKVIQKAFVEVNENGTTAAAATALEMVPMSAVFPRPQPIIFTVDRPFIFLLFADTNTLLFAGRTIQP